MPNRVEILKRQFTNSVGLPFRELLPESMSQDEFAKLPAQVQVREIHLLIQQKGFRSKEIILVTTLLDAKVYTKAKLAQLYQWRWQVEVDLRHVKTTLG